MKALPLTKPANTGALCAQSPKISRSNFGIRAVVFTFTLAIFSFLHSTESAAVTNVPDTKPPTAATGLVWSVKTYSTTLTPQALWKKSVSLDLGSQKIQFFQGAKCNTAFGSPQELTTTDQSAILVNESDGAAFTFKVISTDNSGNSLASACSAAVIIDATPPLAAVTQGWEATRPMVKNLISLWTKSTSTDVAKQVIRYYTDGNCGSLAGTGAKFDLGNRGQERHVLKILPGKVYYFNVLTIDKAGNETPSVCSSGRSYDGTPPTATINQADDQADPTNTSPIRFKVIFNEAISAGSFAANDITQKGTIKRVTWSITNSGDSMSFAVTGTPLAGSEGTVIPYLRAAAVMDPYGNPNLAATSTDANVRFDAMAPVKASQLSWNVTAPTSNPALAARWVKSKSADLAQQRIQIYAGGACDVTIGGPLDLNSTTAQTYGWTAPGDDLYTFKISSLDAGGNTSDSACSPIANVDSTPPSIHNVLATTGNGVFGPGVAIHLQIKWSEIVNVTGVPQIQLTAGPSPRFATYSEGSGTAYTTFVYTVEEGDEAADLEYASASALALSGGTIKDLTERAASVTLPPPGTPGPYGSLGANQDIVIDTVGPAVTISAPSSPVFVIGAAVNYTLTYSQASEITLTFQDISINTTGEVVCSHQLTSPQVDVRQISFSNCTGSGTIAIQIPNGTASDEAGNFTAAAGPSAPFRVDPAGSNQVGFTGQLNLRQGGTMSGDGAQLQVTFGNPINEKKQSGAQNDGQTVKNHPDVQGIYLVPNE